MFYSWLLQAVHNLEDGYNFAEFLSVLKSIPTDEEKTQFLEELGVELTSRIRTGESEHIIDTYEDEKQVPQWLWDL